MTRRLLGPLGGPALFLVFATLVFGVLGWVTHSALKVEQAQREAAAQAELGNNLRVALWRLDGRMLPALGVEDSRPFYYYGPADPLNGYGVAATPLLTTTLPDWMKLHFQLDVSGWESPQVLAPDVMERIQQTWPDLPLQNVNAERGAVLADLRKRFPAAEALDLFASRDHSGAADDGSFTLPAPAVPTVSQPVNRPIPAPGADSAASSGANAPSPASQSARPSEPRKRTNRLFGIELQVCRDPIPSNTVVANALRQDAEEAAKKTDPVNSAASSTRQQAAIPQGRSGVAIKDNDREGTILRGRQDVRPPPVTAQPKGQGAYSQNYNGMGNTLYNQAQAGNEFKNSAANTGQNVQNPASTATNPAASGASAPSVLTGPGYSLAPAAPGGIGNANGSATQAMVGVPGPTPTKPVVTSPLPLKPSETAREKGGKPADQNPVDGKISPGKSGDLKVPTASPEASKAGTPTYRKDQDEPSFFFRVIDGSRTDRAPASINEKLKADKRTEAGDAVPISPVGPMAPPVPPAMSLTPPPAPEPVPVAPAIPSTPPMAIHLGSMRAQWVVGPDGSEVLALVRIAKVDGKTVCQGIILDWAKLQAMLGDEVKDLFPDARLLPVKDKDLAEIPPDHVMTALPVQLDPGPQPEPPPAGWTTLRLGLALAWAAALVAFLALGFCGWTLIDLAERRIRFVSAVTHELRTPLTSLRLYLDMLVSGMVQDEAKAQEYLSTLAIESDRLHRLIDNVLDFARLEKRRQTGDVQPVLVADLLEQLRRTWTGRLALDGKDLQVVSTLPEGQSVKTDAAMVQQIVGNLIDNARKYSRDAADNRVWIWAKPAAAGGVVFEVEDRGPGVPVPERRSIFKPFRRGAHADRTSGGAGLGLALAKSWTEVLGGRLTYRPADGGTGACFRLELGVG